MDDPNDVPLYPYPYRLQHEEFMSQDIYNCNVFFRHDDLKQMLDSNRDNLKLEAMKRIIGVRECVLMILIFIRTIQCICHL